MRPRDRCHTLTAHIVQVWLHVSARCRVRCKERHNMKPRGWHRFEYWLGLLLVMGLFAACVSSIAVPAASEQSSSNGESGGELIVGLEADVAALDPAFAYDPSTSPVVNEISEGLLKFKNGETLEPNLAESWENPNPTTYIYHIRQGVTFHDGTPMTIDDV